MTRYLNIVFLYFFASASLYSQSEQYHVEHLTEQDGLSHGCISCILQDSKGFMWFGTEGGLNRYDGYTIKEYRLPNNFIRTLFEDDADNGKVLWIGTKGGGLVKFDKETEGFIQYQHDPNDPTSLSHNEVKCIYKDKAGVYWIGTEGGGLNKFDRENGKFVSYQPDPNDSYSLNDKDIMAICEDYLGNLWIGTYGVNKFDRKTERFLHYEYNPNDPNGLPTNGIMTIYEDHKKVLWIGTSSGLCTYDRNADQFVRYRFRPGAFNHLNFWTIHEDTLGELWLGIIGGGIVRMNQQRDCFFNFQHDAKNSNSLNSNGVSSIFKDKSGIIWTGTYCEGINKLIPVRKKFEHFKNVPGDSASLSNNAVLSIFEDNDGVLWIGATGGGLNKFDRKKRTFTRYRFDNYWYDGITDICQSKSGALWLARGRCLTEFNPQTEKFTNYYGKYLTYPDEVFSCIDSLIKRNDAIASIQRVGNHQSLTREFELRQPANVLIIAGGEGSLSELFDYGWVDWEGARAPFWKMEAKQARYARGAFKNRLQVSITTLKPGKYKLHYQSNSKHAYKTWAEMPPDNPEIWGIFIFPIARNEIKAIKPLLATEEYRSLWMFDLLGVYEDRSGKLWCQRQSRGELHYFDPDAKQFIPHEIAGDGDISSDITVLFEDRSGDFWFGTFNNGILRQVRGETGTEYIQYKGKNDDPGSISNNRITVIYEDQAGLLWIGTDDGLNKFDKNSGTFIRYTQKDGVAFGRIMGILEDNKGNLWVSTSKGLAKFHPPTGALKYFDENDGLPGNQYNPARCKSKDGQMFFGGTNGLVAFYPDSIQENLHQPQIALTDFQILNQSVVPGKNSPLKKAVSEAEEIVLPYTQNMFSFKFAALDFTCPEKNQYAYKMEGFHDDWIRCGSERIALFMNLNPGTYIFKVKASNNDGLWNEKGASIKVIITPPWWQTRWAYASYVLLLIALVFGTIRFEVNRQKRKSEARLREEQERRKLEAAEHRAVVAELQAQAAEAQKEVEKEQMRSRIAGDLHDEIGSNLSSIAIISQMLEKKLKPAGPEKQRLAEIPRIARATAESMRDIIWFVNPENDSMEKLLVKMRQTANLVLEAHDFTFHAPAAGMAFIADVDFRRHLYLIYKEILQNIVKHAQATKVEITINKSDQCLGLRVADNGIGFDPAKEYPGNGLKNFKRRAQELGGTVEVTSRQGHGTVVALTVKIP